MTIGCVTTTTTKTVAIETAVTNHTINKSKNDVFKSSLIVAQMQNLNVAVIERDSGLIRFETATLSPAQLDQYCMYPIVYLDTNKPVDTFSGWDARSKAIGSNVMGKVSVTLLITESGDNSNINIRSNWSAYNAKQSLPCNSTGTYETEFIKSIEAKLQI